MNYVSLNELFAWLVGVTSCLYSGCNTGFLTEYIYEQNTNTTKLTTNEASWIGGSGTLLMFSGSLVNGYIMDKFGRKFTFYIIYGAYVIGWLIIAETTQVILGRIIISFAVGLTGSSQIYLSEIQQSKYRGAFLATTSVFEIFGNFLMYFIAYYISIEIISLILSIFALLLFVSTFVVPETPYWYMLKNKKTKAIRSLRWLRNGYQERIDYEIEEIEINTNNVNNRTLTFAETIFHISWWKNFLFFSVYIILSVLVGFDSIISYSIQFFEKFNRTQINNKIISIIFITTAFIGTIVTVLIVEKFNRIPLVKYTNLANAIFLSVSGILGTYFHSKVTSILSLLCFFMYSTTVSVTSFTVPWTIVCESLPTEFRATVFAAICFEYSFIYYLNVQFFLSVLENIPVVYIIYAFAFFSILNYAFVHYFLEETKGIILRGNKSS